MRSPTNRAWIARATGSIRVKLLFYKVNWSGQYGLHAGVTPNCMLGASPNRYRHSNLRHEARVPLGMRGLQAQAKYLHSLVDKNNGAASDAEAIATELNFAGLPLLFPKPPATRDNGNPETSSARC